MGAMLELTSFRRSVVLEITPRLANSIADDFHKLIWKRSGFPVMIHRDYLQVSFSGRLVFQGSTETVGYRSCSDLVHCQGYFNLVVVTAGGFVRAVRLDSWKCYFEFTKDLIEAQSDRSVELLFAGFEVSEVVAVMHDTCCVCICPPDVELVFENHFLSLRADVGGLRNGTKTYRLLTGGFDLVPR